MDHTNTQRTVLRDWLQAGHSITPLDALRDFGIYRLASRISELKKEGYEIVKAREAAISRVTGKTVHFTRYSFGKKNVDIS